MDRRVWFELALLGARDVLGARSFLAVNDLEGDDIADPQIIESYSIQILGMEEKIFRFAFASDESKSPIL